MKKYVLDWETDFCDDFPERSGQVIVEAESEDEATKKFSEMKIFHACLLGVSEIEA